MLNIFMKSILFTWIQSHFTDRFNQEAMCALFQQIRKGKPRAAPAFPGRAGGTCTEALTAAGAAGTTNTLTGWKEPATSISHMYL